MSDSELQIVRSPYRDVDFNWKGIDSHKNTSKAGFRHALAARSGAQADDTPGRGIEDGGEVDEATADRDVGVFAI